MIRSIQTLVDGVVAMNFIFRSLKIPIQVCLKEITGPKMNQKHILSILMQMIQSYRRLIKKVIKATVKQSGDGDRNFKMILPHACYGQQKISMNAIIRLYLSW